MNELEFDINCALTLLHKRAHQLSMFDVHHCYFLLLQITSMLIFRSSAALLNLLLVCQHTSFKENSSAQSEKTLTECKSKNWLDTRLIQ